ncbi:MAG: AtzH-like domain-containing protein [Spartobacteria bacterium]
MTRAFLCFLLLSLGMISAGPLEAAPDALREIRAVIDAQEAAWNRGDIDGFMAGYARAPQTAFVSGDEITRGWQTVRNRYAKKYDSPGKMGKLSFLGVTITPLCDDVAMVLGSWSLRRKEDHPHGKFTLLFRKLPEGWRIVLDHTS